MAKAVTLKDKDGNELYPVTSMDLIVGATYREAALPSGNINLPANTLTQVQTLTLPAGVWRICYMIRGYYSGNPAIVETFLYDENNTSILDVAINAPVAYGTTDARWQAVGSPVVSVASGTKTYKTMVRCSIAGTISGTRGYLYAFRVG